jgi:hypothetical protein
MVDSDSRRAVSEIRCSGRSSRPVSHQLNPNASTVITTMATTVISFCELIRLSRSGLSAGPFPAGCGSYGKRLHGTPAGRWSQGTSLP